MTGVVSNGLVWLQQLVQGITPALNKIVIFTLILFIGFLVGKILGRLFRKILGDLKVDEHFRQRTGAKFSLEKLVGSTISGLIYLLAIILALNAVGFTFVVVQLLIVVIVLSILLSVILSVKDTVQNVGARIFQKREFKVGTYIRMDEAEGEITEVNLLDTVLETPNGDLIIVPNALFMKRNIRILKRKPRKKENKNDA